MAKYTQEDVLNARLKAERVFERKKKEGVSLVRRGELSKEDYYQRIRDVAIKTKIIEPDEYPGALPSELETVFELALGIPGYLKGFAVGGPAGGALGFGAGSATGQGTFDTLNLLLADEGQITKPGSQIAKDMAMQFGIDASLSYGIDKVVVPVVKGGFKIAGDATSKAVERTNKVFGKLSKLSAKEKEQYIKQFGDKTDDAIRQNNKEVLADEALTATRFSERVGTGGITGLTTGIARATSVVPGANIKIPGLTQGGVQAFKNQEDDLLMSLGSRLDAATAEKYGTKLRPGAERDPLIRPGSFGRAGAYSNYERAELLPKYIDENGKIAGDLSARSQIPFHMLNNLNKLAMANKATYEQAYKTADDTIANSTQNFNLATLGKNQNNQDVSVLSEIQTLNSRLAASDGFINGTVIGKGLPDFLKKFVAPTRVPFKYTGTVAQKEGATAVPEQLTGKEVFKLKQDIKNLKSARGLYTRNYDNLSPVDKNLHGGLPAIEKALLNTIERAEPSAVSNINRGNKIYSDNLKLLNDNVKLSQYAKAMNDKSYNAKVYDDLVADFTKATGVSDIPTFAGRGLTGVKPDSSELFKHYLGTKEGLEKLKNIMTDQNGVRNLTKNEKLRGEQEYANLIYSEIETMLDKTLMNSLREMGEFNTQQFLKDIGAGATGNLAARERFKTMLKTVQDSPLIKQANAKLPKDQQIPHLQNLTYDRIVNFMKAIEGFQPSPKVTQFLVRRMSLATASGAKLNNILPLAGATAAAGSGIIGGAGGLILTMGLMNLFNAYMRSPVNKSMFAEMRKGKRKVSEFFEGMMNSPEGQKAIAASNMVGNFIRNTGTVARQTGLVGLGQEPLGAPRVSEQYETRTRTNFD